ncbi:hypothetical protein A5792_02230 [Mycolicibacterium peregrinum]|uniref:Cytochrome P450 n=1 Tax=Mycolicibacterium peregrinum TaxID=43304 RepID=A0A1A0RDF9_MYCPR|nr:hypothetical protein [Mycolicibacterium peregrinum]OBB32531.1 hypothetical protein A5792_02230 [Mycolicibacterium peregrinum]
MLTGPHWTSDPRANPTVADAGALLNPVIFDASKLFADGSAHHRLRGAVRDVFGSGFIDGLREGVEIICHETISGIPSDQTFDAMADIALPLPVSLSTKWSSPRSSPRSPGTRRPQTCCPALLRYLSDVAAQPRVIASMAAVASEV